MATYATVEDFENYVEGWVTEDEEALERTLERAERDVDRYCGPTWPHQDNGLRFGAPFGSNVLRFDTYRQGVISRATCAQAEYRIQMGEEFFVEEEYDSVSGPDFSTQGKRGRYGPKMREELNGSGLVRQSRGRAVV